MINFNYEASIKLDKEISQALSDLANTQESLKDTYSRQKFLIKERKIIYQFLIKVNKERLVIQYIF